MIVRVVGVIFIISAGRAARHVSGYAQGPLAAIDTLLDPAKIVALLLKVLAAMGCAKVVACDFVVQASGMAHQKEIDSKVDQAQDQQPAGPAPDVTVSLATNRMESNGPECQHEVPCESVI